MEAMLSYKGGGSENGGQANASVGYNHHILDNIRADDHFLSGTSIHHGKINWRFPNPGGLPHCLLCGSHFDHSGCLRPSGHASLEKIQRKPRYASESSTTHFESSLIFSTAQPKLVLHKKGNALSPV